MGFNLKLISKEEREYFNKLFCYLGFTYFCYQKVCSHVVAILDFFSRHLLSTRLHKSFRHLGFIYLLFYCF